ncbi:MAG: sigma-70 family RNA polymerase sigma factor [Deltaproteobacteria bacterium]|nr:sigma-70 family RNA polymerase sigma factor [Deltaproteobacteria bacterium]
MADAPEADLIERARRGDRAAFGTLVRMNQRRLFSVALHVLGDRGEAEDATQETFLRAYRAIDRFDGRSAFYTWLYRICVNVSLNVLRRRKRVDAADLADPRVPEQSADPTQGQTDPTGSADARALYSGLAKALDALSPSLRTTVVMVLIDGVPQKEAASVLGCSEGTIAWRVHEARRRLREALGDDMPDEMPALPQAKNDASEKVPAKNAPRPKDAREGQVANRRRA